MHDPSRGPRTGTKAIGDQSEEAHDDHMRNLLGHAEAFRQGYIKADQFNLEK